MVQFFQLINSTYFLTFARSKKKTQKSAQVLNSMSFADTSSKCILEHIVPAFEERRCSIRFPIHRSTNVLYPNASEIYIQSNVPPESHLMYKTADPDPRYLEPEIQYFPSPKPPRPLAMHWPKRSTSSYCSPAIIPLHSRPPFQTFPPSQRPAPSTSSPTIQPPVPASQAVHRIPHPLCSVSQTSRSRHYYG